MPEGYYVPFSAVVDAPYWHYKFGQGPKANNSAGIIPKGGLIHVQGPAGSMGRHPPERIPDGRGTDHRKDWRFPACAGADDEFLMFTGAQWLFTSCSENASSMWVGAPSITLSSTRPTGSCSPLTGS